MQVKNIEGLLPIFGGRDPEQCRDKPGLPRQSGLKGEERGLAGTRTTTVEHARDINTWPHVVTSILVLRHG